MTNDFHGTRSLTEFDQFVEDYEELADDGPVRVKEEPGIKLEFPINWETKVKQESIKDAETKPNYEPTVKLQIKTKHESTADERSNVKREHRPAQSVLGKRTRTNDLTDLVSDIEREEESENEDMHDDGHAIVEKATIQSNADNERYSNCTEQSRAKPKTSWNKSTRKHYKTMLKSLPDPEYLIRVGEEVRISDYKVCRDLAVFLSDAFESQDKQRIEAGHKLRNANASVKKLKGEATASKNENRKLQSEQEDLRKDLRNLRSQNLSVQAQLDTEKKQRISASEEVDQLKATAKSSRIRLIDARQATKTTIKEVLDLREMLTEEKKGRADVQANMEELAKIKEWQAAEVQRLKAEARKMNQNTATTKANHLMQVAGLSDSNQNLQRNLDELKKNNNERKLRYDAQIDEIVEKLGAMKSK